MEEIIDAVHQHVDNLWYFRDELWAECLGPYETRGEAQIEADRYGKWLLGLE